MLGLSGTVSSGSTLESLYSITFDGTDDYVDTGATFNTTFVGSFTISMWVKPDDGQGAVNYLFGSANNGTNDAIRSLIRDTGKIHFVFKAHDGQELNLDTDAAHFDNGVQTSWTHLAFVVTITGTGADKTTALVYVNGSSVAFTYTPQDLVDSKHLQWETDQNLSIGAYNNNGTTNTNPLEGKIDEVSIWNVSLDANNVAAIYNSGRPTNLALNSGNYNQSSALQAYYRMGNGTFDDKANGVVHDQNTSNIVYDGDFPNADNWTIDGGNAEISNGKLNFDDADQNATSVKNENKVVSGKTYLVNYTISDYVAGSLKIRLGSEFGSTRSSNGTFSDSIVSNGTLIRIYSASNGTTLSIDNISITEVGGGHGFGSEIFANGWDTLNLASPAVNSNGRITVETNHSGLLHKIDHVSDGDVYKVVMDLETYTGGTIYVGGTNVTPTLGLNTYYIRSAGANTGFGINNPNNFIASNLSVKKLNGIPALTSGANGSGFNFTSDTP